MTDRSTTCQPRKVGASDLMAQKSESLPLEEQVEILKQQLAQAQNLTALGELVSTTTHEFNNVLMTIINYAKYGLRHQDKASREKAFEKILSAGQPGGEDHERRARRGTESFPRVRTRRIWLRSSKTPLYSSNGR